MVLLALLPFVGHAAAQVQLAELGKRALPANRDQTRAVAIGDVDGDGDLDVVFGNGSTFGVGYANGLSLNDGFGIFADASATHMPANGGSTQALALVDVDGDGDLDVAVANEGQNALLRNDGRGHFSDVTAAALPAVNDSTRAGAAADVDGDGDVALLVGQILEPNQLARGQWLPRQRPAGLRARNRWLVNDPG